jgi:hypothetical protein
MAFLKTLLRSEINALYMRTLDNIFFSMNFLKRLKLKNYCNVLLIFRCATNIELINASEVQKQSYSRVSGAETQRASSLCWIGECSNFQLEVLLSRLEVVVGLRVSLEDCSMKFRWFEAKSKILWAQGVFLYRSVEGDSHWSLATFSLVFLWRIQTSLGVYFLRDLSFQ